MLIRREGTEVTVIKYQVPRIVGVIEPTCVELGQLSQQFLRFFIYLCALLHLVSHMTYTAHQPF